MNNLINLVKDKMIDVYDLRLRLLAVDKHRSFGRVIGIMKIASCRMRLFYFLLLSPKYIECKLSTMGLKYSK